MVHVVLVVRVVLDGACCTRVTFSADPTGKKEIYIESSMLHEHCSLFSSFDVMVDLHHLPSTTNISSSMFFPADVRMHVFVPLPQLDAAAVCLDLDTVVLVH
jgi:hypothetical protein